jgi:hypothetical protein
MFSLYSMVRLLPVPFPEDAEELVCEAVPAGTGSVFAV